VKKNHYDFEAKVAPYSVAHHQVGDSFFPGIPGTACRQIK
jgi:hypothetical protein